MKTKTMILTPVILAIIRLIRKKKKMPEKFPSPIMMPSGTYTFTHLYCCGRLYKYKEPIVTKIDSPFEDN